MPVGRRPGPREVRRTLGQSDIASYESSHPYTVHATTPFELVVFALPRSVLGPHGDRLCHQTALRITGSAGIGQLAASFFLHIAERLQAPDVHGSDFDVGESVLDLVRALYTGRHHPAGTHGPDSGEPMLVRIKAYIEANLGDPDLSPALIAKANSISVRYLYKLFESEQIAVGQWIRQRRLDRCRRDIADPALSHETIFGIASRWGWVSAAHFSRLFRATYGCPPRSYRERIRHGEANSVQPQASERAEPGRERQDRDAGRA
jgi:AraC-like DNA-binding protein